MSIILALAGSLLAASGTVPYVLQTISGKTKPRLVTWLTWCILTGVAAAGSLADHQIAAGIFALIGSLATSLVVVFGLRHGDRSFNSLDIACLIGVVAGLGLWLKLDDPVVAVWTAIVIDFVGFVPTYKHAWERPEEETLSTYVLITCGGVLALSAAMLAGTWSVTALGYPAYVALSMTICTVIILSRQKNQIPAPEVSKVETRD
jgi:hypothetical protein